MDNGRQLMTEVHVGECFFAHPKILNPVVVTECVKNNLTPPNWNRWSRGASISSFKAIIIITSSLVNIPWKCPHASCLNCKRRRQSQSQKHSVHQLPPCYLFPNFSQSSLANCHSPSHMPCLSLVRLQQHQGIYNEGSLWSIATDKGVACTRVRCYDKM